jgi:hypothetical protein
VEWGLTIFFPYFFFHFFYFVWKRGGKEKRGVTFGLLIRQLVKRLFYSCELVMRREIFFDLRGKSLQNTL